MTSKPKIHIACSIDEGYVMPLCGMLSSFFEHHRGIPISLHVFTDALSPTSRNFLEHFIFRQGADFHHYTIASDRFQNLHLQYAHFSKANFYRLLIPDLVKTTDRVLYLDVDILVRRPLISLFNTELGDYSLAAAPDAYPPADCQRLGIPEHLSYFNSGILVMDLPAWRRNHIADQALDYLIRHNGDKERCRYADQDGLNAVLQGQWHTLKETWNFNIYHCTVDPRNLSERRRELLREGPAIIHFADRKKPWMRNYALPFQQEFLRNARRNGIHFGNRLTLRTLWPRIQELRQLRQHKARYQQARCPWRA